MVSALNSPGGIYPVKYNGTSAVKKTSNTNDGALTAECLFKRILSMGVVDIWTADRAWHVDTEHRPDSLPQEAGVFLMISDAMIQRFLEDDGFREEQLANLKTRVVQNQRFPASTVMVLDGVFHTDIPPASGVSPKVSGIPDAVTKQDDTESAHYEESGYSFGVSMIQMFSQRFAGSRGNILAMQNEMY